MFKEGIFSALKKKYEADDEKREIVIAKSRKVNKISKEIIYSINRKNINSAEKSIKKIDEEMNSLIKDYNQTKYFYIGSFKVAMQEYVEALAYYKFIKSGSLLTFEDSNVPESCYEYYLLGICDLTGELVRQALIKGIEEKFEDVKKIQEFVSNLYNELLQFDFRNGEIRKKYDGMRWDLQKLEEMVFNLKMRDKL